jgi:hypothetical protein
MVSGPAHAPAPDLVDPDHHLVAGRPQLALDRQRRRRRLDGLAQLGAVVVTATSAGPRPVAMLSSLVGVDRRVGGEEGVEHLLRPARSR